MNSPARKTDADIERVYREYADMLYRLALTYMHSREDAEDAVHDAYVSYMRKAPAFDSGDHEKAWLCRVTVNKCRDALRRRTLRTHASLDDITELAIADEIPADISSALGSLPEKLRVCVTLHYLEGFSVEEVAKIVGSTVPAVKMRLLRARERLRTELGREE